jgi:16S rRNA G966 N2-methylase RsmD
MFEIKEIPIRDLRTNNGEVEGLPRNPRKISNKQLDKLKKSLKDAPEMLRLRELIVVPHGVQFVVIAGNQRLEAAKAVGMETLPCKVLTEDTDPAKLREYAIKDNLPFGEDDWEVISSQWDTAELEEWGMIVPEKWKDNSTAEEDDFDADSVKETICKNGDIWQLGDHRLMCGDSTDAGSVALLMNGEKADMVFLDPPYDFEYDIDNVFQFVSKNSTIFLMSCDLFVARQVVKHEDLFSKLFAIDFRVPNIVSSTTEATRCDIVAKFKVGKSKFKNKYDAFSTLIECFKKHSDKIKQNYGFKQAKAVKLPAVFIEHYTDESEVVLDLFGGVGSTICAAEQLGRKCYTIEIDQHNCDVIIARWEKLTGKKATKINNYAE